MLLWLMYPLSVIGGAAIVFCIWFRRVYVVIPGIRSKNSERWVKKHEAGYER